MAITTKSFSTLVSDLVTAAQGAASQLIDTTVGSILLAIFEANAGIALWLQGIALNIAALTRFATSNDTDADSWGADFGFEREAADAASGSVTFARFTPTNQAVIPVGTLVLTTDGSQSYAVIADTTQSAYNASQGAYIIPANTSSITATVQAVTAGSASNAIAGVISQIGTAISGVDTVTNAAAFTNGSDAESDSSYKARFPLWLLQLAAATVAAVKAAISSVQQGLTYSLVERQTYLGATQLGYFYAVVDDGSGAPPSGTLANVANAIEAVRPIGSQYAVYAPVKVTAAIALTITSSNHAADALLVQTALAAFANSLTIGQTFPYTRIAQIAYDASSTITNVSAVTLNSGTADLTATNQQVIRAGTVTVS